MSRALKAHSRLEQRARVWAAGGRLGVWLGQCGGGLRVVPGPLDPILLAAASVLGLHSSSLSPGEGGTDPGGGHEGHRPRLPRAPPPVCRSPGCCPGPQALRVNRLEQLCTNLASERLQLLSCRVLLAQEQVGELTHAGEARALPWAEAALVKGK